ncbi:MAG: chorismate mutase [Nanoarchaeota archaeon]|nr:chorismate mutase [Nanoarchaeota archaeon]
MIQEGTKGVEQSIEVLRNQIDLVDTDIIGLLSERKKIVENIGRIKKEKRLNVRDVKREKEVLKQRKKIAKDFGLDEKFVAFIFQKLMDYAKQAQKLKNKK